MDVLLPALGENIASGEVVRILVKVGDAVKKDQGLIELETDKAVVEVPSPESGIVGVIQVAEGDTIAVGSVICVLKTDAAGGSIPPSTQPIMELIPEAVRQKETNTSTSTSTSKKSTASRISPSVRKLARELAVDLNLLEGSGRRITADDVKRSASRVASASRGGGRSGTQNDRRVAMTKVRRITAERVTHSWQTIPHVTQGDEADLTKLMGMRVQFAPRVERAGGKLTVTAIMIKIVAAALKVFPQFNARVEGSEIIYHDYCHIGVAVDTKRGLLVPVICEADKKNILDIAVELTQLSERARNAKLMPDELQGGCFTITNLGGLGTTFFTPIINEPEVAILGLGAARQQPVWSHERWEARLVLPLSLSYDHRVIDGADAARFLRWICEAIAEPFLVGLEG